MVTKVYFPREIFPFSAVLVCLVDFAVAAIPLVVLMIYYRVMPPPQIVLLPLVVAIHIVFTAAVALLVSMANLFYRDVKYLFELVMGVWMFATSVLYPVQQVGGMIGTVLRLNPLTPIIDAYRAILLGGATLDPQGLAASAIFSCVLLMGAWVIFHRSEFEFAENI
jgi:ABC-type polysaccharide/polyol phosphate export permease